MSSHSMMVAVSVTDSTNTGIAVVVTMGIAMVS